MSDDTYFQHQNLRKMFPGYNVVSAKILRDTNGINRGVGFARLVRSLLSDCAVAD